jgi:Asp-tRNA(Asn)/Glu-tRNA(Gln) amidotransferase A subunit family amidase
MIIENAPDAVGLRTSVLAGHASAEELAQAAIDRIQALEAEVHAWEILDPALALAQARGVDRRLAAGEVPGLLAGVPLAVKDIFDTADLPTGHGSPIYRGHRPCADAHAVRLARQAGAVVMGKTVTTEFAYFTPGPTVNPRRAGHTPGGSSSGSAAAVAAGMVPLAFGSQTAGSLIRPASYCGVFALKPTHGVFSLEGVKPFAPSLDTLGWLARSADDLELMRCALLQRPFEPLPRLAPASLRVAACRTREWPAIDAGGVAAWDEGLGRMVQAGMSVPLLELPDTLADLMLAQKTVMAYEAARHLAREYEEHQAQLSGAIRSLVGAGLEMAQADYQQALALAQSGRQQVARLMHGLDALVVPAAPGEAPAGLAATGDPVFSRVWTLLGLPCVNVPGLFGPTGLPVGLQLVGHAGRERELLIAAAALHAVMTALP